MNRALVNPKFDYQKVSSDEAGKLRYFEAQLLSSRKRVADEIIKHGEILHGAQQLLASHSSGVFVAWLDSCGISQRSAYNAISAYVAFASFANLQNLEVSAMYVLATNEAAKKKALRLADNGVKVTHAMAKKLVEQHKPAPQPQAEPTMTSAPASAATTQPATPSAATFHQDRTDDGETSAVDEGPEGSPATDPPQQEQPPQDAAAVEGPATRTAGRAAATRAAPVSDKSLSEVVEAWAGLTQAQREGIVSIVRLRTRMPESLAESQLFCEAWSKFVSHRAENGKPLKAQGIARNLALCEDMGPDAAARAIDNTIRNGWQGIFKDEKKRRRDASQSDEATAAMEV